MKKKGFLQISFSWLFAILVGVVILFLAIYGVTKLFHSGQTYQDVKTSKELGILLNPLETSFQGAQSLSLTFPVNTRLFCSCNINGEFGKQLIRISQESFKKWSKTNIDVGFQNKYIFSKKIIEGKKMFIFSKPFNFPFKISDLIYIVSSKDKYCFIDAPDDIKEELENLNQENLLVDNCSQDSIKVCFENNNCDINVDYLNGIIDKKGEKVYFYSDSLMYAGIFADKEIYECGLKRLMKRAKSLAEIYKNKANLISDTCETNMNDDLDVLTSQAGNLKNSEDLFKIIDVVENLEDKNNQGVCNLW